MVMAMAVIITAATAAIMSTERLSQSGRLTGGVALIVSVAMTVLAASQAYNYSTLLAASDQLQQKLQSGDAMSADEMASNLAVYRLAISRLPDDALLLQDLGRLELRMTNAEGVGDDARRTALQSASGYFRRAMAAAPARAFLWSLQALTEVDLNADPARIVNLLRYSSYLGRYEASSILIRAKVALPLWDQLPADIQNGVRGDLRMMWRYHALRDDLIDLYFESEIAKRSIIRHAALLSEKESQNFNYLLRVALGLIKPR